MFTPVASSSPPAFSKQTLVLPIISKGNVGQLACDLLIASLSLERIGFLDASALVPVVGARENGAKGVSTPLEVFSKSGCKLVVVQQRSPVLKSHKTQFIRSLLSWIRTSAFESVILLAGMDTTNRSDAHMHTPTYTLTPPASPSPPASMASVLSMIETYTVKESKPFGDDSSAPSDPPAVPLIPGAGLTRRLFTSLPEAANDYGTGSATWSVPIVALLQYAFEGDNRGDAGMLLAIVNKLLDLQIQAVKEPESWHRGLYGSAHDGSLFG